MAFHSNQSANLNHSFWENGILVDWCFKGNNLVIFTPFFGQPKTDLSPSFSHHFMPIIHVIVNLGHSFKLNLKSQWFINDVMSQIPLKIALHIKSKNTCMKTHFFHSNLAINFSHHPPSPWPNHPPLILLHFSSNSTIQTWKFLVHWKRSPHKLP